MSDPKTIPPTQQVWSMETNVPFSQSLIWDLQRRYYEEMGTEAWRQGEVPHYVTSNLRQANAYAEMIVALHKDHRKLTPDVAAPIYILELGGGSGRFAYYLLRRLHDLCACEDIPPTAFRYLLTDFTQSNLDFWRIHPCFQPYFERGELDIALFDVTQPGPLHLQIADETLAPGRLDSPAVVIANYVWDSIPQELLHIDAGVLSTVNVSVSISQDPATLIPSQVLEMAEMGYTAATEAPAWMASPLLRPILEVYRGHEGESWLLFPALAIRCLAYLRSLSPAGFLLLTGDKGGHHLHQVLSGVPPTWASHGSISLNVNYHALQVYVDSTGGVTFFPDHLYHSINTGCLLLLRGAQQYTATLGATRKYLDSTGPDTYFTIYKCIRAHLDTVELRDILAALRLSLYDSHQLGIYIARIAALLPTLGRHEMADLLRVMHRCWENYFALAEGMDLATLLGSICYTVDAYEWALYYFSQSTDIYGPYTGTFFNMAVCHHMLGDGENARLLLEKVVAHDPGNAEAQALLTEYTHLGGLTEPPA